MGDLFDLYRIDPGVVIRYQTPLVSKALRRRHHEDRVLKHTGLGITQVLVPLRQPNP